MLFLGSVVDENESLKVRVRDLQNELQQTKLLLIHSGYLYFQLNTFSITHIL